MLNTVANISLVFSVLLFIVFLVEWLLTVWARWPFAHTTGAKRGTFKQEGAADSVNVPESLKAAAELAAKFKEAGPMYTSLVASILFLLIAAVGFGLGSVLPHS